MSRKIVTAAEKKKAAAARYERKVMEKVLYACIQELQAKRILCLNEAAQNVEAQNMSRAEALLHYNTSYGDAIRTCIGAVRQLDPKVEAFMPTTPRLVVTTKLKES